MDVHKLSHVILDAPQEEKLVDGSENPKYNKWRRSDKLVLIWIKFTVATSVQNMITYYKTTKKTWERLEKFLTPVCNFHVCNLWENIWNTKKTTTMIMANYLMAKCTAEDML